VVQIKRLVPGLEAPSRPKPDPQNRYGRAARRRTASDLLRVDRLALVCNAGIAGDDEEPSDARECPDDLVALSSKASAFSGVFQVVPA